MSIEGQILSAPLLFEGAVEAVLRALSILLFGMYFIFSLVVLRQVNLMTETLITEAGLWMRAGAIIHAGFALAVTVLFIGLLFG